jgi:hypothetical protein
VILKGLIAAMSFSLASLFGCAKHTPASHAKGAATVVQSKVRDLGVLQMTNHFETCVALGANQDCRIVPNLVGRSDLRLTLTLESKPLEVSIGKTDFTFTPRIAAD